MLQIDKVIFFIKLLRSFMFYLYLNMKYLYKFLTTLKLRPECLCWVYHKVQLYTLTNTYLRRCQINFFYFFMTLQLNFNLNPNIFHTKEKHHSHLVDNSQLLLVAATASMLFVLSFVFYFNASIMGVIRFYFLCYKFSPYFLLVKS
jgi:hypothetical protein